MATRSRVVTIGTTPTVIVGTDTDSNTTHRDLAIRNDSAVTVYLGGPDVTTSNGFPILAGESMAFDGLNITATPHAVAAEAVAVRVLEVGV